MVNVGFYKDGPEQWHFYLGGKIDVGTNELPPKEGTADCESRGRGCRIGAVLAVKKVPIKT